MDPRFPPWMQKAIRDDQLAHGSAASRAAYGISEAEAAAWRSSAALTLPTSPNPVLVVGGLIAVGGLIYWLLKGRK